MIHHLVELAFQTGCLSVESEGLIRQILEMRGYRPKDLVALEHLCQAVYTGQIQRESRHAIALVPNGALV